MGNGFEEVHWLFFYFFADMFCQYFLWSILGKDKELHCKNINKVILSFRKFVEYGILRKGDIDGLWN